MRKLINSMRASAVQIGTLIKAYLILLIQPLVNVLRMFDLDSDSYSGIVVIGLTCGKAEFHFADVDWEQPLLIREAPCRQQAVLQVKLCTRA